MGCIKFAITQQQQLCIMSSSPHSVTDYHIWKTGFDSAAKLRKEAGEIEYYVLTHDDNVNNVVHFSRWKSHDAARSFFESDSIKTDPSISGSTAT